MQKYRSSLLRMVLLSPWKAPSWDTADAEIQVLSAKDPDLSKLPFRLDPEYRFL